MTSFKLCCKHLQFLWDNHLIERREDSETHRPESGFEVIVGITKGFRVRRSFMFLQRDQILYRCPYCGKELIFFDELFIPKLAMRFKINLQVMKVTTERLPFTIPISKMKEALFTTKRRSKHWPPED